MKTFLGSSHSLGKDSSEWRMTVCLCRWGEGQEMLPRQGGVQGEINLEEIQEETPGSGNISNGGNKKKKKKKKQKNTSTTLISK